MSSQDKSKVFSVQGKKQNSKSQKSEKTKNFAMSLTNFVPFFKTNKEPKKAEAEVKDSDKLRTLSAIYGKSVEELVKMADTEEIAFKGRELDELQKRFHSMPTLTKRQYYACGKDFLTPEQIPSLNEMYAAIQSKDHPTGGNYDLNSKICLWNGDITRLEVGAVVNSCACVAEKIYSGRLEGVSDAIMTAASSLAIYEIQNIKGIEVGEVKVTSGYLLPAKYIFHTSGPLNHPIWAKESLGSCYMNCLQKMLDMGLRTIAFSCIATGYKRLPKDLAAEIALNTVHDWVQGHLDEVDKIIFCVYDQPNWMIYQDLIKKVFPPTSMSNSSIESLLPVEILRMDKKSIELYKKALDEGMEAVHNIRVMVVGHFGVGKTTLTKRLFGEEVDINHRESTNGIQVHVRRCKVNIQTGQWLTVDKDITKETVQLRLANLLRQVQGNQDSSCHQTCGDDTLPPTGSDADVEHLFFSLAAGQIDEGLDMPDGVIPVEENTSYSDVDASPDYSSEKTFEMDENTDVAGKENSTNEAIFSLLRDLVNTMKETPADHVIEGMADLSVWDFAGQYAFYATHQVFLSRRAVYLLVTDISKQIDDIVQDDDCYLDSKGVRHCRISEFVDFWLNSIHEFCSDENSDGPPVILVGTFVDKLNQDTKKERIDEFFYKLRSSLVEKATVCHLTEEDFAIDNTKQDDNVDTLKRRILETAARQQYWGELIPAKWITLENILLNIRKEGLKVLYKHKLLEMNQQLPIPIQTEEEVILFLKFHHESGNIIYFSNDENLKETIILDPQWLVDAFKSIITAKMFCCRHPAVLKKWIEFDKSAILRLDLIDAIWERENDFKEYSTLLLEYLEKLGLIAKPYQPDSELTQMFCEYYFAPSVLKEKPPADLLDCTDGSMVSTSRLCFTTPTKFLPTAVFNKLLAVCLAKYQLSHYKSHSLIYCGCGIFDLENNHRLFVYFYDNVIQIWLSRYGVHEHDPDMTLCLKVHEFIMNVLQQYLTKVQTFLKCKHAELDSTEDMFEIEQLSTNAEVMCSCQGKPHVLSSLELKQFWFHERNLDEQSKQPTDQELSRMAHKIGKEYTALGIELGLSQAEMDHINMEQRTVVDKITVMLIKWRDKNGKHATTEELRRAMMLVGIDAFAVIGSGE